MKKFTSFSKNKKTVEEPASDVLFKGDYVSVVKTEGWEVVQEKDCVIVVAHMVDFDEILLRKEDVPSYRLRKQQNHFLTALSGTIEEGEEHTATIVRELEEEAGIRLNTGYKSFKKWNSLFISKGSSAQFHLYYVPLKNGEFSKVGAPGDGSQAEEKSATLRVDLKYLNSLNVSDTVTELALQYLRNEIKHLFNFM